MSVDDDSISTSAASSYADITETVDNVTSAVLAELREMHKKASNTTSVRSGRWTLDESISAGRDMVAHKVQRRQRRLADALQYVHNYIDAFGARLHGPGSQIRIYLDTIKGMISDLNTLSIEIGTAKNAAKHIEEVDEIRYRFIHLARLVSKRGTQDVCQTPPQKPSRTSGIWFSSPRPENTCRHHSTCNDGVTNAQQQSAIESSNRRKYNPGTYQNPQRHMPVEHRKPQRSKFRSFLSCCHHVEDCVVGTFEGTMECTINICKAALCSCRLFTILFIFIIVTLFFYIKGYLDVDNIPRINICQDLITDTLMWRPPVSGVGLRHYGLPPF